MIDGFTAWRLMELEKYLEFSETFFISLHVQGQYVEYYFPYTHYMRLGKGVFSYADELDMQYGRATPHGDPK